MLLEVDQVATTMEEPTENNFVDEEIVWVKFGPWWWPGEVIGIDKVPQDLAASFKKPPIAVVKFFQEDTFEYVRNSNNIFKYNCERKNEFIKKGMDKFRTGSSAMEKFPDDVVTAENRTGGDPNILERDDFKPTARKGSYAGLFGTNTPTNKKGKGKQSTTPNNPRSSYKDSKPNSDYQARILIQSNSPSTTVSLPTPEISTPQEQGEFTPSTSSGAGLYSCHACNFTTTRMNVLVLHTKTHSGSIMPYLVSPKTIPKSKPSPKSKPEMICKSKIDTPKARTVTPKKTSTKKLVKTVAFTEPPKVTVEKPQRRRRRRLEEQAEIPPQEMKRQKTDEEIKSSLLADWSENEMSDSGNDDQKEGANDATPSTSTALSNNAHLDEVLDETNNKPSEPETSAHNGQAESTSCFDFRDDEEWPVSKEISKRIPRISRDSESKSKDDLDLAKEVEDLLEQTKVPDLPVPPPLPSLDINTKSIENSIGENFQKREAEGAPPPTKVIFKTKTFFRSRHSRSQDAIEKYVAEQLRADMCGENGPDNSIQDDQDSSVSTVTPVAKPTPKIQLKKTKAESQLCEKMESDLVHITDDVYSAEDMLDQSEKMSDNLIEQSSLKNSSDVKELNIVKDTEVEIAVCLNENTSIESNVTEVQEPNLSSPLSTETPGEILNEKEKTQNIYANNDCKDNDLVGDNVSIICKVGELQKEEDVSNAISLTECSHDTSDVKIQSEPEKLISTVVNIEISQTECVHGTNEENNQKTEKLAMSTVDTFLNDSKTNSMNSKVSDDPPDNIFADDFKINEVVIENGNEMSVEEMYPNVDENIVSSNVEICTSNEEIVCTENDSNDAGDNKLKSQNIEPHQPSESDLQIAETLLNLPSTVQSNKDVVYNTAENNNSEMQSVVENTPQSDTTLENEIENSDNLNAAESLVQMSKTIDFFPKSNPVNITSPDVSNNSTTSNDIALETKRIEVSPPEKPSRLLQILEEPLAKTNPSKAFISSHENETILNFQVGPKLTEPRTPKSAVKQKIIIRKATQHGKVAHESNNSQEKIVLSRKSQSKGDSAVPTYTIETNSDEKMDPNPIIIQQKIIKSAKSESNLIKIQPKSTIITSTGALVKKAPPPVEDFFDINSMPIVLSDDIITTHSYEELPSVIQEIKQEPPIVPKIIAQSKSESTILQKIITRAPVKRPTTQVIEKHVVPAKKTPPKIVIKSEQRVNPNLMVSKTPNIISKTSKFYPGQHTVATDHSGGRKILIGKSGMTEKTGNIPKHNIIKMTNSKIAPKVNQNPSTKFTQNTQPKMQNVVPKIEQKFIIMPSSQTNRTQKLLVNTSTGKAQLLLQKPRNVSQRVESTTPDTGKVMIITNAHGAKSRLILTPEHEKLLFPQNLFNKTSNSQAATPTSHPVIKPKPRIISKSKPVQTTLKQMSPIPRIIRGPQITSTQVITHKTIPVKPPKAILNSIQKEPMVILQHKTGPEIQLTQSQFEFLQKTGQIVHKAGPPVEENNALPKNTPVIKQIMPAKTVSGPTILISPKAKSASPKPIKTSITQKPTMNLAQTPRISLAQSPTLVIKPASNPIDQVIEPSSQGVESSSKLESVPQLPMIIETPKQIINTVDQPDLNNLEDMLPATAIQQTHYAEPAHTSVEQAPLIQPMEQDLSNPQSNLDNQILAVPGENFGGPPDSFFLCVEENGTLIPIDERPLILENNQLVPMTIPWPDPSPVQAPPRDILAAALANTDVFPGDVEALAPDFRDLNANVAVNCIVSETSTTLNTPIMSTLETPTSISDGPPPAVDLDAVLGVGTASVPRSLDLPITVTDPRIASASMPIIDDGLPKSMPILSEHMICSSIELNVNTESENTNDSDNILITPGSISSEEIPIQPTITVSTQELPLLDATTEITS